MKCIQIVTLFILICASSTFAQREVVDKIMAVVGDEVILISEFANQLQLVALQTQKKPKNEAEMKKFQSEVLEQMVSDRMFLLAAKEDTTISIRNEEIEQMLEDQVARISQNYDNYDAFIKALNEEGLTLRELKKKYRLDVENQLLKQRFIQKKLYSIAVSKHEVEAFYAKFQDSIPSQPEAVKLAHVLLTVKPSQYVLDSVQSRMKELRQMILDGADFAVIATNYASEGAGINGGDLGYLSKNDVVPEFSRAAFALQEGDISGVIKTQFGYHIIKCEGIKGDKHKLRHVLLKVAPSVDDTLAVKQLADSLVKAAWDGDDFAQMAKTYSDDNDTRVQGGELGWFASTQMPPEFIDAVKGWTEVNDVRGPVQTRYGFHILKLLDYQKERIYNLKDDFDQIKELAKQDKTGQFVDEWIKKLKKTTYIKYYEEL